MEPIVVKRVGIQGHSVGAVTLSEQALDWVSSDKTSTKNVPWADVDHATWANFGKYCHLRLFLKGDEGDEESSRPPIRLDGFQRELYGQIKPLLQSVGIDLKKEKTNCGGGNYGEFEITPSLVRFGHDGRSTFDLNLSSISQCVLPGKNLKANDVELQFHESEAMDDQAEDCLVEMRLYISGANEDQGEDGGDDEGVAMRNRAAAEEFVETVSSKADIGDVKGSVLCEFDSSMGTFLTPRGRYALEMYGSQLRMHGPKYDYRIKYSDISRLFLLEKPDERYMAFVISLDNPIRQGQQRYQHLVLQSTRVEESIRINMEEADLQAKYEGALQQVMTGPLCNLIAKVFKSLTGKTVFITGKFRSGAGAKCVACAMGANEGHLYPLNKSFIFIHKPTRVIAFDDVEYVEFQRYGGGEMAGSARRSFDFFVRVKAASGESGKDFTFSGIDRSEYPMLYNWCKNKSLRIQNLKESSANDGPSALQEALAADESDGEDGEVRRGDDMDESEEDGDYAPAEDSGAGSASSSEESDDSDSEGDGGGMKKKKKKQKSSSVGTEIAKKRKKKLVEDGGKEKDKKKKKKDPNAPKKARSAYVLFNTAKRGEVAAADPDLSFGDIGRKLGEMWRQASKEEKVKFNQMAADDKQRYQKEMKNYKGAAPAADNDDDSGSDSD